MANPAFGVKPFIPVYAKIIIPVIYLAEAICVFAGGPALTGLNGLICTGLYGCLIVLFHLTPWPVILLPISVIGATAYGIPAAISLPLFLLPSVYGFFFVRAYRRQTYFLSSRYKLKQLAKRQARLQRGAN